MGMRPEMDTDVKMLQVKIKSKKDGLNRSTLSLSKEPNIASNEKKKKVAKQSKMKSKSQKMNPIDQKELRST